MKQFFKKTLKHTALALALLLLIGAFSSCNVSFIDQLVDFEGYYEEYKVEFDISFDSELYGSNDFYYRQLDSVGQMMYNAMVGAIESGKNYHTFKGVDAEKIEERVERVVYAIYSDRPDLFWLELGWYFAKREGVGENNDQAMLVIGFCDFWNVNSANGMIYSFEEKVTEIVDEANKLSGDYEKIKYVHDLIVSNTEYNEEGMENNNAESNSSYTCLVENKAVCGGYSRAFQLLMNRLGIDCISVFGRSLDEAHMWNCVWVEGEPYFMDLTWADHDNAIIYEWFCASFEDIKSSHFPNDDFSIPACTADKYNFYVYNGYIMNEYDRGKFNDILLKQKNNKAMFVKFSSVSELRESIIDLITRKKWQNLSALENKNKISYYADEEMLIFIIYN